MQLLNLINMRNLLKKIYEYLSGIEVILMDHN